MILMIAVPILTMRSMSDEHRARTDQLLLTSPVSVWGIVMGKFLSMVTILASPLAIACLCPPYHPKRRHRLSDRGLCIYTGFLPFGMCVYCHWAFHLLPYGKPAHSRCRDLRHTAAQHPLARAFKTFIPAAAAGSLAGFLILWTLVCFIIYRLTGHIPLSLGLEAAGAAVLIGTFFVKQSMFERALTGLLGKSC